MPKPEDPGGRGREGYQEPYGLFQPEYDGGLGARLGMVDPYMVDRFFFRG